MSLNEHKFIGKTKKEKGLIYFMLSLKWSMVKMKSLSAIRQHKLFSSIHISNILIMCQTIKQVLMKFEE